MTRVRPQRAGPGKTCSRWPRVVHVDKTIWLWQDEVGVAEARSSGPIGNVVDPCVTLWTCRDPPDCGSRPCWDLPLLLGWIVTRVVAPAMSGGAVAPGYFGWGRGPSAMSRPRVCPSAIPRPRV